MATPKWRMTLNRARGHATQTCSLWRVSSHSSKTELSQTFPARIEKNMHRGTYLIRTEKATIPSPSSPPSWPSQVSLSSTTALACLQTVWLGAGRQLCFVPVTALLKSHSLPQNGQKAATFGMREMERKKPQRAIILRALLHSFYTAQILTICTKHRSSYGIFLNSMILVYYAHWCSIVPKNPVKM